MDVPPRTPSMVDFAPGEYNWMVGIASAYPSLARMRNAGRDDSRAEEGELFASFMRRMNAVMVKNRESEVVAATYEIGSLRFVVETTVIPTAEYQAGRWEDWGIIADQGDKVMVQRVVFRPLKPQE